MTQPDTFERFDGRTPLGKDWLNRNADAVEKLLRLRVSPPLELRDVPGGMLISMDQLLAEGFWARLTAGGSNALYSWERLGDDAETPVDPPEAGTDTAKEVNGETEVPTGEGVGAVVWLWPASSLDPDEWRFEWNIPDWPVESFWATIVDDEDAPEYAFDFGIATEVNGVRGIAVGTTVRVFEADEDFAFEYDGGAALQAMERMFDFMEPWPALVHTAGASLDVQVWIPGSSTYPPAVDDDYHLNEDDDLISVDYDKVGPGTFADKTLLPCLQDYAPEADVPIEDWIQVRCAPGAFVEESADTPVEPDGHINTFSGTLVGAALPYSFTLEYEVSPGRFKRLYCNPDAVTPGSDFQVALLGDGTGWVKVRTGAWSVTLADCPPTGATMRCRYIPISTCKWSWLEVPQSVEGAGVTETPYDRGNAADAWLRVEDDDTSPFYRALVHNDPQTVKLDTSTITW